jgi:hypothetical protein
VLATFVHDFFASVRSTTLSACLSVFYTLVFAKGSKLATDEPVLLATTLQTELLACSQSSVHHPISATNESKDTRCEIKEIYRRLRQKRTISLVTKNCTLRRGRGMPYNSTSALAYPVVPALWRGRQIIFCYFLFTFIDDEDIFATYASPYRPASYHYQQHNRLIGTCSD